MYLIRSLLQTFNIFKIICLPMHESQVKSKACLCMDKRDGCNHMHEKGYSVNGQNGQDGVTVQQVVNAGNY